MGNLLSEARPQEHLLSEVQSQEALHALALSWNASKQTCPALPHPIYLHIYPLPITE